MWRKLLHGFKVYLWAFALVLLVFFSAPLYAQESTGSLPEAQYVLSESDKQQLMKLLQSLSDKIKTAQENLSLSEQALAESRTKLQLTEEKYRASQEQLLTLQKAWEQLATELEGLRKDKELLTQNLSTLQETWRLLEDRYLALEQASTKLEADYRALVQAYQEQTQTLEQLQVSFSDYKKSVQSQQTKSLILEIIIFILGVGWGLDAIGVF